MFLVYLRKGQTQREWKVKGNSDLSEKSSSKTEMGMKEGDEPGWCVERRVGKGVRNEGNGKYTPWGSVCNMEDHQGQQD